MTQRRCQGSGSRIALWIALVSGCGEGGVMEGARRHSNESAATGDVVLVVDGVAVRADDVAELQRAGGLSGREALARLEAEALLMAEAERRGYAQDPQVQVVAKQALAQAYLGSVENEVTVSDAQVAAEYARQRARFDVPERRACLHLLAPLPRDREATHAEEDAARELAEQAQGALLANVEGEYAKALEPFQERALVYGRPRVEPVPLVPRNGLVKPFADALFAASAPGPLTQPVRSVFGWHAVVLTQIEPAESASLAQATPTIRAELLAQARAEALTARVEQLRAARRPEYVPGHRERVEEPVFDP